MIGTSLLPNLYMLAFLPTLSEVHHSLSECFIEIGSELLESSLNLLSYSKVDLNTVEHRIQ